MTHEIVLGTREVWGEAKPFGLSAADRLRHLYVIGQTGVGKSTFLRNLAVQDILAGRGLAVIDAHGDESSQILDLVPPERVNDVVYYDPSDRKFSTGLNMVGPVAPERRQLVASGIVGTFRGIWSDSWGPRLEYILHATISALLECEHVSLMGAMRMLSDESYREWVVRQVRDPMVRSFWRSELGRYDKRFLQEAVAPIQNKIGQLLLSPQLRNSLGQIKSGIDARYIMDNRRIFIANLSKGKLGDDNTNLLGALLVTQFQLAAMSRADIPESERTPFHLYVDEFQSFVSESFAAILSEARKYGLSITVANQFLAQIHPKILAAVKGNVGSIIAFRVGAEDAEAMSAAFGNAITPAAFTALGNGEVYAKILENGHALEPFPAKTMRLTHTKYGRRRAIIRLSRQKYSRLRRKIEKKIDAWTRRLDGDSDILGKLTRRG